MEILELIMICNSAFYQWISNFINFFSSGSFSPNPKFIYVNSNGYSYGYKFWLPVSLAFHIALLYSVFLFGTKFKLK